MNRSLEFKRFLKKIGCVAIGATFLMLSEQCQAANLPAVATDATIYSTHQTFAAGEDVGVTINGIAWLLGGFTITAGGGNVTFRTPVSVGAPINLAADTQAVLSGDLTLAANCYVGSSGVMDANGYALVLTGSLSLNNKTITFQDTDAVIEGNGNIIDLQTGSLIVGTDSRTLTIRNAYIRGLGNGSLTAAATRTIVLDNVVLEQDATYAFANGNLSIYGNVLVTGAQTFQLSSGAVTIQNGAILSFDHGTTFDNNGGTVTNNEILHFNGCTVDIAGAGLDLSGAAGVVLFENRVRLQGNNALNNSNAGSTTKVLSGATVELKTNAVINVG